MISALYGCKSDDLEQVCRDVETILNLKLVGGDGLHNGGEYYHLETEHHKILLRENIDLDDDEGEFDGLHEPEFHDFKYLIYIFEVEEGHEVLRKLDQAAPMFERLRNREY